MAPEAKWCQESIFNITPRTGFDSRCKGNRKSNIHIHQTEIPTAQHRKQGHKECSKFSCYIYVSDKFQVPQSSTFIMLQRICRAWSLLFPRFQALWHFKHGIQETLQIFVFKFGHTTNLDTTPVAFTPCPLTPTR